MYTFIAMRTKFPVGIPEFIAKKSRINTIEIKNGEMLFEDNIISGILRVSIVPPVTLFPFLIQRIENKVYGACCNMCLKKQNRNPCHHSEAERMITDVYTVPEIVFAVEKCGYKLVQVHELLAYK